MALFSKVFSHNSEKSKLKNGLSVSRSNSSTLTPTISKFSLAPIKSSPLISSSSSSGVSNSSKSNSLTFSLSLELESPSIVLYGQPHESSGYIISGNLSLNIKPPSKTQNYNDEFSNSSDFKLTLETVTLSLIQTMRYSRPFVIPSASVTSCKDCQTKVTVLARWDVLTTPTPFSTGSHAYPFSHFLPGSLPPTSKLGSTNSKAYILYELVAVGKTPNSNKETKTKLPLFVSRLILRGPDRNSLRVFPPTEVSASAVVPNVVYPKSTFPIELKLDNVVSLSGERRWRMRKLSWKIDEKVNVRAHCCENHLDKLAAFEELERKNRNSPRHHSKQAKNTNLHHSTITTNVTLTRNSGTLMRNQSSVDQSNNDPTEIEIPTDQEYEEQTNPTVQHDHFVEDFINPVRNDLSVRQDGSDQPEVSTLAGPSVPVEVEDEEHIYMEETRTVAHGDIKTGWKSDFSDNGSIILVADINAFDFSTGFYNQIQKSSSDVDDKSEGIIKSLRNAANVSCDVDDPVLGVFVSHTLILSVVVAEELVHSVDSKKSTKENPLKPVSSTSHESTNSPKTNLQSAAALTGVPTGAARVLRMEFKLTLTERSGLGIAWDDEVPPTYHDVKTLSPPNYNQTSSNTPALDIGSDSTPRASAVIYGIGNTPLTGSFLTNNTPNIDTMISEDTIQEFRL